MESKENGIIDKLASGEYKYGFSTDIETETIPIGLSEDVVRWISAKKESSPNQRNDSNSSSPITTQTSSLYTPGIYTSSISIGDTLVHLELVCDENHINSVRLVNLDEAVATMYPLLHPALEDLELQLSKDIPLEELTITEGSQYTQNLLIEAIENTLTKATSP